MIFFLLFFSFTSSHFLNCLLDTLWISWKSTAEVYITKIVDGEYYLNNVICHDINRGKTAANSSLVFIFFHQKKDFFHTLISSFLSTFFCSSKETSKKKNQKFLSAVLFGMLFGIFLQKTITAKKNTNMG